MSTTRSRGRRAPATEPATAAADGDAIPEAWRHAEVILLLHGSNRPGSGETAERHAAGLRERGWFAGVTTASLKGPSDAEAAVAAAKSARVYLVPLFMSAGHFVRNVIPERLGLDGPVTRRDGRAILYCPPLGVLPALADVVAARARRTCAAEELDPATTGLLLIGHGSSRDSASAQAARDCAAQLASCGFASVEVAFLEQEPLLSRHAPAPAGSNTVAVGLFASPGEHSERDVRDALGIAPGETTARSSAGDRVAYAGAIGGDPAIADVIVGCIRSAATNGRAV